MARLLTIALVAALAFPAVAPAESLILSQARTLARKVARQIAGYYGAEDWKVKGCYKTSRSRGRCVIRFFGWDRTDRKCSFAINVVQYRYQTKSSFYAGDCL